MEALDKWKAAQLHLKEAASGFLDASIALRKVAAQPFLSSLDQITLENVLDDVQSRINSIGAMESCIHESHAVRNALLNASTLRVPINKLPPEILGYIFSILTATSPCYPKGDQRDALLDIIFVCGRWYQVATNNRSLWSHIDLYPGPLALNRTRLWLERSRGTPIQVHLGKDIHSTPRTDPSNLISILQPHATFANSLTISGEGSDLARAELALYFDYGKPSSLKTLAVWNIRDFRQGCAIPWPACPLRGLVTLQLYGLSTSACPTLDEMATMLSDCPELQTLQLMHIREFVIRPGQHQIPSVISLPQLRLLEITFVFGAALPIFLSMLRPGNLILDVRLNGHSIGWVHTQLLLARSNVVHLTISDIRINHSPIHVLFSHVPRLHALHIHLFGHNADVLPRLGTLTDDNSVPLFPYLQYLSLSGGQIYPELMNRVKQVVTARRLHNLVFSSCTFLASYDEQPNNAGNQGVGGGIKFLPNYFKEMPESTKQWLSGHVQSLVVR